MPEASGGVPEGGKCSSCGEGCDAICVGRVPVAALGGGGGARLGSPMNSLSTAW